MIHNTVQHFEKGFDQKTIKIKSEDPKTHQVKVTAIEAKTKVKNDKNNSFTINLVQ